METLHTPRWLVRAIARPTPAVRLYCFPHGGGSIAEYVRWAADLPGVELWGVQLPGRGSRLRERPFTRMEPLVRALLAENTFAAPFAFFGHSMGSLVAYEVTRALRDVGRPLPERLFVSAYPAPHLPRREPAVHHLADDELLAEVERRHGGVPAEALADPALKAMIAGCLRADYELIDSYEHRPAPALPVPLTVLGGREDHVTEEELTAWAEHSTRPLASRRFAGGHFYHREHRRPLLRTINATFRQQGV
ncbi:thioesterase II family protein [Longispora urticae]